MTEETKTRYTYIGRRKIGTKLHHSFIKGDDATTSVYWEKVKPAVFSGTVIGAVYEVGEKFPPYWHAAKVGNVDTEQALQWQAIDRAAYLSHSQKSVDPSPELTRAIEAIERARTGLPFNQRVSFDVWLLNQIR